MKYVNIKGIGRIITQHGWKRCAIHTRAAWHAALLLLGATALLLAGCPETPGNPDDTTAPEPITISDASISTTPSSITFGWTPSVSNDVAEVQVTWTPEDGEDQPKIIAVGSTETTITGLNADTLYTFSITTIDTSDNPSEVVEIRVTTSANLDTIPPAPITISNADITVSPSSISLQWDPSPSNDVAGVQVTWTPEDGEDQPKIIDVGSTETTITGLNADTLYTFSITTIDTSDNPSEVVEIRVTTSTNADTTPPAPVTTLNAVPDANGSDVTLTWADGSADVDEVHITWMPPGTMGTAGVRIGRGIQTATITGLNDGIEYTFTLVVEDAANNRSTAETVMATTPDVTDPAPVTTLNAVPDANGSDVTLTWADGSADVDEVHITWMPPGTMGTAGVRIGRGIQTATITGLNDGIEYTFTLVVEDAANNRSTAETVMATTPDVTDPAPVTTLNAVPDANGSDVTLTWADGSADVDEVHITWMPPGTMGTAGVRIGRGIQTATITGLNDGIEYTFTLVVEDAANNRSTAETVMATTPDVTDPAPVTTLNAVPDANGSDVTLTWADGSADVDEVHITWMPPGTMGTAGVRIGRGIQTATITGLNDGIEYTFTLVVEDAANNRSTAETVMATTPDVTDPAPVTTLNAVPDANGSDVTLTWADGSADVDEVHITWMPPGTMGTAGVRIGRGIQTATITGLNDGIEYTFTLVVEDAANNRSTAETVMATTPDVTDPAPISGLNATANINGSDIKLTWTASPSADASMVHITWTPAGTTGTAGTRVMQGARTATITGLNDDTEYTFTLVVEDAANNRSTIEDVTVSTIDVTDPAPLTDVRATATAGTTDVTLSWTNSISADATIIRISWNVTGSAIPEDDSEVAHGPTTSTTITGLNSEEDYEFTLIVLDDAVDVAGNTDPNFSVAADASVRTSDINPPAPVSNFTVTPLASGHEVELSWRNSGSADAHMLNIAWSSATPGITPGQVSILSAVGDSTRTIGGLTFGTPYTFTITVVDTAGNTSNIETADPDPVTTLVPFSVLPNGVTIVCPGIAVGDTFTLNGTVYTRRTDFSDATANTIIRNAAATTCTTGATSMARFISSLTTPDSRGTFNADISHWDVSQVTDMRFMFSGATTFDQDISNWDVSQVTDMNFMFFDALAFNQDISGWCVSAITSAPRFFSGGTMGTSALTSSNTPVWGTCP